MSAPESRPAGFYDQWPTFVRVYFAQRLARADGAAQTRALLAAGAGVLGTNTLVGLVAKNKAALALLGPVVGLAALPLLAAGGAAVLVRTAMRGAASGEVQAIRNQLTAGQTEFEALLRERSAGRLEATKHRNAVEALFARMVA